jgi:L-glyceraldehyde reductase
VAFQKGDSYFPLVANSTVEGGDVVIDDGVSIVDTWKGRIVLGLGRKNARN